MTTMYFNGKWHFWWIMLKACLTSIFRWTSVDVIHTETDEWLSEWRKGIPRDVQHTLPTWRRLHRPKQQ